MVVLEPELVDLGFSKVVVPDDYVLTHLTRSSLGQGKGKFLLGEEAVIPMSSGEKRSNISSFNLAIHLSLQTQKKVAPI